MIRRIKIITKLIMAASKFTSFVALGRYYFGKVSVVDTRVNSTIVLKFHLAVLNYTKSERAYEIWGFFVYRQLQMLNLKSYTSLNYMLCCFRCRTTIGCRWRQRWATRRMQRAFTTHLTAPSRRGPRRRPSTVPAPCARQGEYHITSQSRQSKKAAYFH